MPTNWRPAGAAVPARRHVKRLRSSDSDETNTKPFPRASEDAPKRLAMIIGASPETEVNTSEPIPNDTAQSRWRCSRRWSAPLVFLLDLWHGGSVCSTRSGLCVKVGGTGCILSTSRAMIANGNEKQLPQPKVQDRERRCPNCDAAPRLRHKLLERDGVRLNRLRIPKSDRF